MATKKIAVLFGMEDTFPWALMNEIRDRSKGEIEGVPVEIGHVDDELALEYDVIVDRISHEVPFYRTWLKKAIASGSQIVNNPIWWSADDKFFDNLVAKSVGVAVPRTVVLPHKEHPPNTQAKSFRNLKWVDWPAVFSYVGFPMFMKPAYGGGWKDVYKVDTPEQFFEAYDQTHSLTMMAQEAIEFEEYYRCYVIGRERVHVMRYDPKQPHHLRYVQDAPPTEPKLLERIIRDAKALCDALGYDLNTVEFAVRDGVPIAIDFMNPAPDADLNSVGEANFRWVVENMAEVLIDRVRNPRPFEPAGTWPSKFGLATK
jgi:hypothetical protein